MPDLDTLTTAALGRAVAPSERIAIAVSGGPDSLALLILAAAAWPGRVIGLTVDHGLRPAASAETAGVARQCAAAGIAHATLVWAGPKPKSALQAAAREARYALMAGWCATNGVALLLTAHHADDQAETLLMRLGRSSGAAGLSGIRRQRVLAPGVTLLRPLLGIRRADLAAVVAGAGWQAISDPANSDPRFARSQARALLAATPWLDAGRLAAAAAHHAEAETALAWASDRAWAGRAISAGAQLSIDVAGLPAELVQRLVRRAIATLVPAVVPDGGATARLVARLAAGGSGTLAGVKARGGDIWCFSLAPPRRHDQGE